MKRHLLSALTLGLLAGVCGFANAADKAPAGKAASGIAVEYIDPSVRAQDDFFVHTNGKWLATTEIPADKSSWGAFHKLHEDTQPQLRKIIEDAAASAKDADQQRIGDFYASFMDEARVEQLGVAPIKDKLAKIAAIGDKKALPQLFAEFNRYGVTAPINLTIHQDNKDSTKYVVDFFQDGLGLPDRDYYLKKDDAKLAEALAKYELHVAKMLTLAGDANAAANAKAIVAFETDIAKIQWSKVELRDPVKAYNKYEIAKVGELMPGFDWNAYLAATGVQGKATYVIVSQPTYFQALDKVMAETPLATLKAYAQWQLIHDAAPYLSKAFVDENFAFYGTTLSGAT